MFFLLRKLSKIPILGIVFSYIYRVYNLLYGASIPLEVVIPRFTKFPHGIHGIFISKNAVIGERTTIYHQVTIGSNQTEGHKMFGSPTVGDDCFMGVGTKIIGKITVGNNVILGSNVSVARDIPDSTTVVLSENRFINR